MSAITSALTPEQQRELNEKPVAGIWEPTTPAETRAVDIGLDNFAPRLSYCGKAMRWGCHFMTEGKYHRQGENRSRCMGGFACEPCTKAHAIRHAIQWESVLTRIPPDLLSFRRFDFKIPCKLGKTSAFTIKSLPKAREKVQKIKSLLASALRSVPTYFGQSWIWNYTNTGFLYFSVLYAGTQPDDVFTALYKAFPGVSSIEGHKRARNPRTGLPAVSSIAERTIPRNALRVTLQEMLSQYPRELKGVRGVEVKALFQSLQRVDTWGDCLPAAECTDSAELSSEATSEVCNTDPLTNFDGPNGPPMRCWCGEICTHVVRGGSEPPSVEEFLKHPVGPPG